MFCNAYDYPRLNWKDRNVQQNYIKTLSVTADNIKVPDYSVDKQSFVDNYYNELVSAMHNAAKISMSNGDGSTHKKKRKFWWNSGIPQQEIEIGSGLIYGALLVDQERALCRILINTPNMFLEKYAALLLTQI